MVCVGRGAIADRPSTRPVSIRIGQRPRSFSLALPYGKHGTSVGVTTAGLAAPSPKRPPALSPKHIAPPVMARPQVSPSPAATPRKLPAAVTRIFEASFELLQSNDEGLPPWWGEPA